MSIIAESNRDALKQTSDRLWRVVIVDDHPVYRDGIRNILEMEPGFEVVGEAESEGQAFTTVVESNPDLVTVDVSLASGNGLNLIARLKNHKPTTIVLVVSMYEDRVYAELALAAGANGYVVKGANSNQIREAIQCVITGGIFVTPNLLQDKLAKTGHENATEPLKEKQLSSRELQIFMMIGQGRTTQQIAAELHITVSTVETYRERLKTKLNLVSGTALTRHAIFWMMQSS